MKIVIFTFLAFFSPLVLGQEVNNYLVLPLNCSETQACGVENGHCNPLGQCQCNFNYFPFTEHVRRPICNLFNCFIDADCVHFYGPNSRCVHEKGGCDCQQNWKIDPKSQSCIVPE